MSQFDRLLRQSKLFSLPPRGLAGPTTQGLPHAQVLKTTTASQHRRDWGLKMPLPAKVESTLVEVQRLDNERGFTEFDFNAKYTRKIQMFAELGQSVELYKNSDFSSLSSKGQRPPKPLDAAERQRLLRAARRRQLEFRTKATAASVERFLGLPPLGFSDAQDSGVTAIGLSYATRGVMHNTPQGLRRSHPVPGRILHGSKGPRATVAGIVGPINSRGLMGPEDSVIYETPKEKINVFRATATATGQVSVSLQVNEKKNKAELDYVTGDRLG